MKVLIVDDEILVRKGLAMGITWSSLGFDQVFEASNGLQALDIVKANHPELILTDIKMPKMDGLQLIDEVKKIYPDTVILVLSCLNDSHSIREALKFNRAMDYIPKLSMSTDELETIVEKAKTYIKETVPSMNHYTAVLTLDRIQQLQTAIHGYDEKMVHDIMNTCFLEAKELHYTNETFTEWHELFSLVHTAIKEWDGELGEILIHGQGCHAYLHESTTLDQLHSRFTQFIHASMSYLESKSQRFLTADVKNALHYIHTHYQDPIKLYHVANHVNINESYLSRLFKKQLDISFTDYLNGVRLTKAKQLLQDPDLPIYEIATSVGYSSESYFSRIFKNYENQSPKQYRNGLK